MKNLIKIMMLCFFILISTRSVMAADMQEVPMDESNTLVHSQDYAAIQALESEILDRIRDAYADQAPSNLPDTVDYSQALKVYVDTDIQNLHSSDKATILDAMGHSNYVWVIPMVIDNQNIQVTLAKGLPLNPDRAYLLSEDEQQEIQDSEGKWIVSEVAIDVPESYMNQLVDISAEYDDMIIVGGVPGLNMPMALGFLNDNATSWISLGYQYPMIEDNPLTRSVQNGIYNFETIMEQAQNYDNPPGELSGGGNGVAQNSIVYTKLLIISTMFALALLILLGIFLVRRKKCN